MSKIDVTIHMYSGVVIEYQTELTIRDLHMLFNDSIKGGWPISVVDRGRDMTVNASLIEFVTYHE